MAATVGLVKRRSLEHPTVTDRDRQLARELAAQARREAEEVRQSKKGVGVQDVEGLEASVASERGDDVDIEAAARSGGPVGEGGTPPRPHPRRQSAQQRPGQAMAFASQNQGDEDEEALNPEKHGLWRKLTVERMSRVLSDLDANIKVLASRERYDYTEVEWHQKIAALRRAVDEIEQAYIEGGKRRPKKVFSFEE